MDPYVLLTVKTQEKQSTVASGQGSVPEWNETFLFTVSDDVSELHLKIMKKDNFSADDFVEATEGSLPPAAYNVVNKDKEFCGEIKIRLTFTPEPERSNNVPSGGYGESEESYGRWKQSSYGEE
ncbi:hypothetical protein C1H46_042980 [Malus baccata]|uniref:C2 domain-containing protein n=1 Tax=Malus baccata TaxID=106549 RepID=A0A540KBI1_MALBA|nr:hypothetical protein C1H46_042980 [Malus baccata]